MVNNNSNSKKSDDGGREIGDEGPQSQGREPGLKYGNNVSKMRAEMKQSANTAKGQLNQNGQMHTSVKVSSMENGQTTSMGKSSYGSSGSIGVSGTHGNSSGTSGHGSSGIGGNGSSSGGHGASSGGSSGGIGGHGGH